MVMMGKNHFEECCLHRIAANFKNHENNSDFVIIGRSLEEKMDPDTQVQNTISCNCHRKIEVFIQKATIGNCTFCLVKYEHTA